MSKELPNLYLEELNKIYGGLSSKPRQDLDGYKHSNVSPQQIVDYVTNAFEVKDGSFNEEAIDLFPPLESDIKEKVNKKGKHKKHRGRFFTKK